MAESLPPSLAELFDRFLDLIRHLGGQVVDVSFPTLAPSPVAGDLAEMGTYHRQFADRISSYRADNAATVAAAAAALRTASIDYLTAARNRIKYQHEFNRMFVADHLDAVVVPGSTVDGSKRVEVAGVSVFGGNTGDVQWANFAGTPVICTPAGRSRTTGLPFGVQIGGRAWDEQRLIEIVLELQAASPDWQDSPSLSEAPRDIPRARKTTPGAGPDPTNTSNVGVAFNFVPTRSTGEM